MGNGRIESEPVKRQYERVVMKAVEEELARRGFAKATTVWRAVAQAEVDLDKTEAQRAVRIRSVVRDIVAKLPRKRELYVVCRITRVSYSEAGCCEHI